MRSGTPVCPECGHQFVAERRELEHVEGELQEYRDTLRNGQKVEVWDPETRSWNTFPHTFLGIADETDSVDMQMARVSDGVEVFSCPVKHIRRSAAALKREQSSAQSLADLIAIGHRRGMAKPQAWARHVMAAREAKRARSGPVRVVA
jgi:uncharacterized Zn finger protein (UPF0148 family)